MLSAVGAGRLTDSGYFQGKVAQEKLVSTSSIAHTIVHTTQSFEFLWTIADDATVGNIVRLGPVHIQPIASYDVATALGMVATGSQSTATSRSAVRTSSVSTSSSGGDGSTRRSREVVTDPGARYFGSRVSEGNLMPGEDALVFGTHFGSWPAARAFSEPGHRTAKGRDR